MNANPLWRTDPGSDKPRPVGLRLDLEAGTAALVVLKRDHSPLEPLEPHQRIVVLPRVPSPREANIILGSKALRHSLGFLARAWSNSNGLRVQAGLAGLSFNIRDLLPVVEPADGGAQ